MTESVCQNPECTAVYDAEGAPFRDLHARAVERPVMIFCPPCADYFDGSPDARYERVTNPTQEEQDGERKQQ